MVINNFSGFLGFTGKIFARGNIENLTYFLKDIYGVNYVRLDENNMLIVEGTDEMSGLHNEIYFEENYYIVVIDTEGTHQISINIAGFDEDTNHRGNFVNKLMGYSMKHDIDIRGFVFEDFYSQALKFSMNKGKELKIEAIDYDELGYLIKE